MLGLVFGLVCHGGDSSVAGNQLRSSRMLEFLAALVLLVPCTNPLSLGPFRILWRSHPRGGLVTIWRETEPMYQPIYYFSILSGYLAQPSPQGASIIKKYSNKIF